ncbi:MAG: hypothetical protein ACK6DC_22395 [Planctomycetota bacterium]
MLALQAMVATMVAAILADRAAELKPLVDQAAALKSPLAIHAKQLQAAALKSLATILADRAIAAADSASVTVVFWASCSATSVVAMTVLAMPAQPLAARRATERLLLLPLLRLLLLQQILMPT